ncbi:thiamine phosphate synthase [Sulfurovum sp.]|jgi:thiamine-phosphate pyrophosphorylase|uniref:thiamine phosphate synthase n=1 Tax=Sulfurovum sp. TaxID=1969726 RepID=UPI002A360E68|nr:thiamine phosphate synthase [Sulfurovum sp.]MDD3495720.1 thiamine phosphate synthase [Dysgonamonadaceae bacterium]MDY0401946.1 thiamine phosphate synthase [Sulfurovum sp.]
MSQNTSAKIYALVDKETLLQKGVSLLFHLEHLKNFDIPILQYRNKKGSLKEKKADLQLIREHYQGILIINDTIALIDYADGLHIGQEDIREYSHNLNESVAKVRSMIGRKLLGLSTHNLSEIEEANRLDLDYIGLGAYRLTKTKSEANVGGEALLEAAKYSRHPVGIIGGVKLEDEFEKPIIYKVIGSDLYR